MAGISIDRRGYVAIMDGFDVHGAHADYFSVWQGRDLKFSGDVAGGSDLLSDNLKALQDAAGNAAYTIKFHKVKDKDTFISDKTPCVGSFNFKVNEVDYDARGGVIGAVAANGRVDNAILEKLTGIESRLQAVEEGGGAVGDDQSDMERTIGTISGLIQTPLGQMVTGWIAGLFTQKPAVALAGVPGADSDEQVELIKASVARLYRHDKQLGTHLSKLADIAETNPGQFDFLISMLPK